MTETIYLRVGSKDTISLDALINSLRNFLAILKDFDATISHDQRGSMTWEVASLQKNSPPIIGVAPRLKRGKQDISTIVERQFIENAKLLSATGERNRFMSDAALARIEKLALQSQKQGAMQVYLNGNGPITASAEITPRTLENVRQLTAPKYSAYGSVYGNLDAISVHRGNEFRIWSEESHRAISCRFEERELDLVKSYLKQRVMVAGMIQMNAVGAPISLQVEELELAPERPEPTIHEMSGYVKNLTGDLSMKEYMDRLSSD